MNQVQRKFLIDKITEKTNQRIEVLRKSKPEFPSFSNHVYLAIMSGTLKLKSLEEIEAAIKEKALNAVEGKNWLSEENMGWEKLTTIKLPRDSVFYHPESYIKAMVEYNAKADKIRIEIEELKLQLDTLITRIQLASDKNLELIVREVDDMGQLKLIDSKLKLLN